MAVKRSQEYCHALDVNVQLNSEGILQLQNMLNVHTHYDDREAWDQIYRWYYIFMVTKQVPLAAITFT